MSNATSRISKYVKALEAERDALRALLSDAESWLAMDAPVTIKANIRAALQSTGEKT